MNIKARNLDLSLSILVGQMASMSGTSPLRTCAVLLALSNDIHAMLDKTARN